MSSQQTIAGEMNWYPRREALLKEYNLWEKYGQIPPIYNRDKPVEAYLPGGECYE